MTSSLKWSNLELIKQLGEGQAGIVWLAKLNRSWKAQRAGSYVAVKRYKPWVLEQGGQLERVFRELQIGRTLNHPNVVETLSVLSDNSGSPCLVMKFYEGSSLDNYLASLRLKGRKLDSDTAFMIAGRLSSALVSLHKVGAIHRDVKPANVLLTSAGPILMDLGVVCSNAFPEQTTTGTFLGTVRYAAPEYLFGESYDSRVDVYGLGAIVCELFTGELFLKERSNWAQLVVEKSQRSVNHSCDFKEMQVRLGVKITELVRSIIESSLGWRPGLRTLCLQSLSEAVENNLWKEFCYLEKGRFIQGLPLVSPVGSLSNKNSFVSLRETIAGLPLSGSDKENIKRCLDRLYYQHEVSYRDVKSCLLEVLGEDKTEAFLERLHQLKVLYVQPAMAGMEWGFDCTIKAGYRYGLLDV